jgi:DNA/RNA-binding domain of Phe-tRNA-synthetase-like protein
VVWCDDTGVTCRRWNWRQATRTRLRDDTIAALFIIDALDPHTDHTVRHTADDLLGHLATTSPALASARRIISLTNSS